MIENIIFPEGIKWSLSLNGGDFLGPDFVSPSTPIKYTSSPSYMLYLPYDTSKVTSMVDFFADTGLLKVVDGIDSSSATDTRRMFQDSGLKYAPILNTSKVTNMDSMFYNCDFMVAPELDVSQVTNISNMFGGCGNLCVVPDYNMVKVTSFGGSAYSSWLGNCRYLHSIGVIDCDSITNISYALGSMSQSYLRYVGGFRNLGKKSSVSGTSGSNFMNMAPGLTYESVMNVLNLLYDRASAGLSVLTLTLHPNHLAMLSEDDIAVATNKGWTLA